VKKDYLAELLVGFALNKAWCVPVFHSASALSKLLAATIKMRKFPLSYSF
jgi:hypothetical protein